MFQYLPGLCRAVFDKYGRTGGGQISSIDSLHAMALARKKDAQGKAKLSKLTNFVSDVASHFFLILP